MYDSAEKSKKQAFTANAVAQNKKEGTVFQLVDNRPESIQQKANSLYKNTAVHQLTKSDSAIPKDVTDYFESKGITYHEFKQNHWGEIVKAHTEAHKSEPDTQGAAYTIDAKTGKQLLSNLGDDWQPHDVQKREKAIAKGKKKARAGRKVLKEERKEQAALPRAYKSHEDAKAKLAKQPHLGTKYRLKKGDDTVYDINE